LLPRQSFMRFRRARLVLKAIVFTVSEYQVLQMGLFKTRLIDEAVVEWQLDEFEFLINNLSSGPGLPDGELWLPIAEHFGAPDGVSLDGEALAHFSYERILAQCRVSPDFPVDLAVLDTPSSGFLSESVVLNSDKKACGLYSAENLGDNQWKETITIDLELTHNPTNLIATLAHELGHALHNRMPQAYDGDPALYELFTDLTAVYFGYGIFLANSRFEFSGNNMGWQSRGAGYLPEADLVFATALFMKIKDIPIETAKQHLKPRLHKMLDKAFKQLARYENDIEALRSQVPTNLQCFD